MEEGGIPRLVKRPDIALEGVVELWKLKKVVRWVILPWISQPGN
jgi:hypothetical protein